MRGDYADAPSHVKPANLGHYQPRTLPTLQPTLRNQPDSVILCRHPVGGFMAIPSGTRLGRRMKHPAQFVPVMDPGNGVLKGPTPIEPRQSGRTTVSVETVRQGAHHEKP